jgi:hypothetical protein
MRLPAILPAITNINEQNGVFSIAYRRDRAGVDAIGIAALP